MFVQPNDHQTPCVVPDSPVTWNGSPLRDERTPKNAPIPTSPNFQSPFDAYNFVVNWNGEDVRDLLAAIQYARLSGDRFVQDKLIGSILKIPCRNPRPSDIPAFVGKPVWAVDKQGRVLLGMPGVEMIVDGDILRKQITRKPSLSVPV